MPWLAIKSFIFSKWGAYLIGAVVLAVLIGGAVGHYRNIVAKNEALQAENQRKDMELETAKKNAEIVQKSREIKERSNHAVRNLDDASIDAKLADNGWLRQ